MDDTEVALPRATLQKLIKDCMPPDMRTAGDTVDLIVDCATEFIHLVSSEANELCDAEKKTTIGPEHVIKALEALGLTEFVPEVNSCWETFKTEQKGMKRMPSKKRGADAGGMSEQEAIALQQRLFAQARARSAQLPAVPPAM